VFNRGQFGDLPHKPTIAAKYAAIVATSRRLSFPACKETDASLTFPPFVERNVGFYGQSPLIRLNARDKRPSPGAEGGGAPPNVVAVLRDNTWPHDAGCGPGLIFV